MSESERNYIQECLFVVDCFVDTQATLALAMLKFNEPLKSQNNIRLEWDSIIDALSRNIWEEDALKEATQLRVKIVSNKIGKILKNPTH